MILFQSIAVRIHGRSIISVGYKTGYFAHSVFLLWSVSLNVYLGDLIHPQNLLLLNACL